MKILGIIPARYQSTRFPAKALADINGKPMVQHVYEQALKSKYLNEVVVATDDDRIALVLERNGIPFVMTSTEHKSGTDRCGEVLDRMESDYDAVVNIQGDEPFINPLQIDELARLLLDGAHLASLMNTIKSQEALFDANTVKVVVDEMNSALYFSRMAIPFLRDAEKDKWLEKHTYFQHIGIYGYQKEALKDIVKMEHSSLELCESLEQLRWLSNGMKIKMGRSEFESLGIDTPEDLEKALENFKKD